MPDTPLFDAQAKEPQLSSRTNTSQAGPDPRGKAAIWRDVALFLTVGFAIPSLILLASHAFNHKAGSQWTVQRELWIKGVAAFFVAAATWLVAHRQSRPMADFGIPPRQIFGRQFWEGAVWGFFMLSALVFLLKATGHFRIESVALSGNAVPRYALGWALAFLLVGISEEFTFRGYLLFVATGRMGFWAATLALSIGFAAAHIPNAGETVLGILQVLGTGVLFCFMIRRTGNLWFAVGYHAFWNWAQTFFYGTADSGLSGKGHFLNTSMYGPDWITGGSAGPEGSICALLVLLLCALLVHLRFPKVLYPHGTHSAHRHGLA